MADALEHMSSGRTRLEWLSSLNTEYQPQKNYRRTSIIGTIGMSQHVLSKSSKADMKLMRNCL